MASSSMLLWAGLSLSVLLFTVPVLADESQVEVSQDSTCSRSLIQTQTMQNAELNKTRSNTSKDAWDEDSRKAVGAPATKEPSALMEVEKAETSRAHLKTASAASPASAAISLKEHLKKGDLSKSATVEALERISKERAEAHAVARKFVEFGMTFWEGVIILLVVALFSMLCGYGEFEYKQDPRNFGLNPPKVGYGYDKTHFDAKGKGLGKGKGSQQHVTNL